MDPFRRLGRDGVLPLSGLACCVMPVFADQAPPSIVDLKPIVVTGQRLSVALPDAQVQQQVEAALHASVSVFDEHITITTKNGVVTLHGIVFDDWDMRAARRLAKKTPGVKRVINDLELVLGDSQ
jgi:hypothetical protein